MLACGSYPNVNEILTVAPWLRVTESEADALADLAADAGFAAASPNAADEKTVEYFATEEETEAQRAKEEEEARKKFEEGMKIHSPETPPIVFVVLQMWIRMPAASRNLGHGMVQVSCCRSSTLGQGDGGRRRLLSTNVRVPWSCTGESLNLNLQSGLDRYEADGFIHATHDAKLLIGVLNNFYQVRLLCL